MTTIMVLTSLMITASSMTLLATSPLNLGISILFMALILATMYSSMMSSWIAFLIFLIYVSGMMVMFAYFVALSPNLKTNNLMTYMAPTLFIMIMTYLSMSNTSPQTSAMHKSMINVFYLKNNIPMLLILALILLFTMIVVVKLVNTNKGPLRPFM